MTLTLSLTLCPGLCTTVRREDLEPVFHCAGSSSVSKREREHDTGQVKKKSELSTTSVPRGFPLLPQIRDPVLTLLKWPLGTHLLP